MLEYKHSRYRNLPKLLKRMPAAVAETHPESASKYGICDGDVLIVETTRGKIIKG